MPLCSLIDVRCASALSVWPSLTHSAHAELVEAWEAQRHAAGGFDRLSLSGVGVISNNAGNSIGSGDLRLPMRLDCFATLATAGWKFDHAFLPEPMHRLHRSSPFSRTKQ
jgi:hypothetical protein